MIVWEIRKWQRVIGESKHLLSSPSLTVPEILLLVQSLTELCSRPRASLAGPPLDCVYSHFKFFFLLVCGV